jgi:heterodisulfide reductase subunit A
MTQDFGQKHGERVGVFVCECGMNISGTVDVNAVAEYSLGIPGVVHSSVNKYTCAEPGQQEIRDVIRDKKLDPIVVAACTPRMHEPTFKACAVEAGLNPYLVEMANIREHCSWVHSEEKEAATDKAKDLTRMAVARARYLLPQEETESKVIKKTLVIGGGVAGIQASLDLADAGIEVVLVEKSSTIGGVMAQLGKTFPTMDCPT